MKKQITKIIIAMITIIACSTTNSQARENYAVRGAWIGAVSGGVAGGSLVFVLGGLMSEGCSNGGDYPCGMETVGNTLTGVGIGAAVGGLIGLGMGALIPKNEKLSVTPIIHTTPDSVGGGVNLSLTF